MGKIIFILGGVRSGKSSHALALCNKAKGRKVFLATCQALDSEMSERIDRHQKERGKDWQTIEEPIMITRALAGAAKVRGCVLLDCGISLSNCMKR